MKKVTVAGAALALISAVTIHAQNVTVTAQGGRGLVLTHFEAKVVKGQPYSAEIATESIQTLADGNRIVRRTTGRVYRDSEGRVRREEDRPSGGPTISITDPVAGTTFTLDPANRTARETPTRLSLEITGTFQAVRDDLAELSGALAAGRGSAPGAGGRSWAEAPLAPPAGTLGRGGRGRLGGDKQTEEKLQDRMIEGVLASGARRTTTIDKGVIGNEQPITIVSEEWTSPELQVLVMTDLTDPRTGRSTYRLLNISRLAPDPALFQVPADYTVQRMRAGRGARGQGAGGRGQ